MRPCLVVPGTEAMSCGLLLVSALPGERCSSRLRLASIDVSESESESSSSVVLLGPCLESHLVNPWERVWLEELGRGRVARYE